MCETFAERLKKMRKKRGLTQKELAKKFNLTKSSFSSYENGNNYPQCDKLIKMADFFEVSVDYLLGRIEIENYNKRENKYFNLNEDTLDIVINILNDLKKSST